MEHVVVVEVKKVTNGSISTPQRRSKFNMLPTLQDQDCFIESDPTPSHPAMGYSIRPYICPPTATTTLVTIILGILFGAFMFDFDDKEGFSDLENGFDCKNECEFYGNFCIFNGLFYGQPSCPSSRPTPHTHPTHYHTHVPTHQSREFDLFGRGRDVFDIEYDHLNNVIEYKFYENFDYSGGLVYPSPVNPTSYACPTYCHTHRSTSNPPEFNIFASVNYELFNVVGCINEGFDILQILLNVDFLNIFQIYLVCDIFMFLKKFFG